MKVIWHNQTPISTGEVKKIIDECGSSKWTQQTLQTLLNRLIAKKYLSKDKRGKEYIYTALVVEKNYIDYESKLFLKKLHGNSVTRLVKAFFDSNEITAEDILELEAMLKERANDRAD